MTHDRTETLAERGEYRVTICPDDDYEGPDWDGQGYVFAVDYGHRWTANEVHRDSGDTAPTFELVDALARWGSDWDMIRRWLQQAHDVVSFDYADLWRSGPTYVSVVTRDQCIRGFGLDPDDEDTTYADGESRADICRRAAADALAVWRQWAEGDVWFYAVERRVTWRADDGRTMHTWEHVDSLAGMYGRAYAETEARAALSDYAPEPDQTRTAGGAS